MLRLSDEEIEKTLEAAATYLMREQQPILDALKPTAGPYALFYHLGDAGARAQEVRIIVRRLLAGRERLSALNEEIDARTPKDWPGGVPYPEDVSRLMWQQHGETLGMRLDFESLFHFGSVLLDQWAYAVAYLSGVKDPHEFEFHDLVCRLDPQKDCPPALQPVRDQLLREARWLDFWMRSYRNKFVVHVDRPVQRGMVSSVIGSDFKLFTPSAIGWEDAGKLDAEIMALLPLAPEWLQRTEPSYWERARPAALLERVVENVGSIDSQAVRERIVDLARRKGIGTPTFQVIASVLADFVNRGSRLVRDAALANPSLINLGPPPP